MVSCSINGRRGLFNDSIVSRFPRQLWAPKLAVKCRCPGKARMDVHLQVTDVNPSDCSPGQDRVRTDWDGTGSCLIKVNILQVYYVSHSLGTIHDFTCQESMADCVIL